MKQILPIARQVLVVMALSLALATAVHAFGLGLGNRFGKLGAMGGATAVTPPSCASPTAPDGSVDLSQCSNAYYVALIF